MNILLDDKFQKELLTIIKDYEQLQQENKKQKEVIDKIKNVQIEMPKHNYSYDYMIYRNKIDEINNLKEEKDE